MQPSLKDGKPTRGHTFKENCCFLSQQLSVARNSEELAIGKTLDLSPLSVLGFCLASGCNGFVHTVSVAVSVDVQLPCCAQESFLVVLYCLCLLTTLLIYPCPQSSLSLGKKGCEGNVSFRAVHFISCVQIYTRSFAICV